MIKMTKVSTRKIQIIPVYDALCRVLPCAQRRVKMFQKSSRFVVVTRYNNIFLIKESYVKIFGVSITGFDPDLQRACAVVVSLMCRPAG